MSPTSSVPPFERLERMLTLELSRLAERRVELAEIGDAMMMLRADLTRGEGAPRSPGVEILDQAIAAPIVDRLAGMVASVDNVFLDPDVGAGTEAEHAAHELERAREGQRQRTIYRPEVLDSPENVSRLDALHAAGQEQRVGDLLTHEFAIFSDEVVVTPSVWGDAGSEYLVIRSPVIVGAFQAWFDLAWGRSPSRGAEDPGADERLIELLGLGYKDETIARHLGVALRTVRRRVAALMEQHRVTTRYQLGVALARAGRA
ncbi:hypothetical protein JNO54_03440 [Janibacter sp. YIM B02568]|uniref:helix-turn-helix transcriptional regulator n=1 Tax=Janibacter endophyticus TaxID=2806261 RepID=UPI00194F4C43|nr:hypothetical protein [Janibacter endophyticus]MBM6545196.1 hypothetical protein [Janibacter endophyticus]